MVSKPVKNIHDRNGKYTNAIAPSIDIQKVYYKIVCIKVLQNVYCINCVTFLFLLP